MKLNVLSTGLIICLHLSFSNMLSTSQSEELSSLPTLDPDPGLRRHILWAEEDRLGNDSSIASRNRSTRSLDTLKYPSPSLALINNTRNANTKTVVPKCNHQAAAEESQHQYINQTENIRIASELHRWIGQPEYLNGTRKLSFPLDDVDVEKNFKVDRNFLANLMPKKYQRQRKFLLRKNKKVEKYPVGSNLEDEGGVDVFRPVVGRGEMKYAELFKELRRRDDTFYVVSFTADHLMVPALAYNKTKRPRMSLMFPAVGFNGSVSEEHVMMMQIDCEVLDTAMIQVREKLIPDHLRRLPNVTKEEDVVARGEGGGVERKGNVTEGVKFGPHLKSDDGLMEGRRGFVRKPYFVGNPRFENTSTRDEEERR